MANCYNHGFGTGFKIWFTPSFTIPVYPTVYHIWFTPVISENFPLESRLAKEREGVPNIERGKCKECFVRNKGKMILILTYKLDDKNNGLALDPSLIVRGE